MVRSVRGFRATRTSTGVLTECVLRVRRDSLTTKTRRMFRARPYADGLTVSRVNGMATTAATVDTLFAGASALIQGDQGGGGDVSCCVSFLRTGAVGTFQPPASMTGGTITTQSELDAVFDVNADVKLVQGFTGTAFPPGTAGAERNGTIVLAALNAATLAHELGHRAGPCHVGSLCTPTCGGRGNCSGCGDPFSRRIMYFQFCAGAGNITASECSDFRQRGSLDVP